MVHQVTVSEITDQRTLTESMNAATDDTHETPTARGRYRRQALPETRGTFLEGRRMTNRKSVTMRVLAASHNR